MSPSAPVVRGPFLVGAALLCLTPSIWAADIATASQASLSDDAKAAPPAAKASADKKPAQIKPPGKKPAEPSRQAAGETENDARESANGPRKIVLVAGPKDEHHGPGTHDYAATANTIKEALEASNVSDQVEIVVVTDGWPEDPAILDDADTIFLTSAGADHKESDHPFLVGDRMKVLEKQMRRGCGLVMLHWSVFVPIKYEKPFTEWLGGFFDYQRGDDPRGWYSAITFATAKIQPNSKHVIGKNIPPFEHRDEYYYRIRFREKDDRVTPIVSITLPDVPKPQVVAWAVERKNGGRSFAFTGGHFQKSWEEDGYRALMLNAICWTAKVPIPSGGVHKELSFDDQWTPKPHLGKEDLPKEVEEDWVDGRIRETDVGPFYTASIVVPDLGENIAAPKDDRKLPLNPHMVVKAMAIKVGGSNGTPPAAVLFDKEDMLMRCGWTGGFLNFSDRRFGLLEMPTIGGTLHWSMPSNEGWTVRGDSAEGGSRRPAAVEYRGLRPGKDRVALSYSVEGCEVTESPSLQLIGDEPTLIRTFEFAGSNGALELPLLEWPEAVLNPSTTGSVVIEKGDDAIVATPIPDPETPVAIAASFDQKTSRLRLIVPASSSEPVRRFAVAIWRGPKDRVAAFVDTLGQKKPRPESLDDEASRQSVRWGESLVTQGEIGTSQPGSPFVVDTVTIPYENRYKALFFMGGFDFAPDGTCYACTAHGDVWKVTGIDEDLDKITWQRFATGLYEPLGLKIRDGEIFVLGRDQITRLHDENGDGEADWYENFNDDLTDHGQSHAYAMCLETDSKGNFYFLKSGAPATPHGGTLLKLTADGKTLEVYATGFRHPNGLGIGPDDTITTADNEGNWTPVTRVDIVERGEFCGHVPTAHTATEPTEPGQPLCWLPRVVDNSAGGQAWVPKEEWGPLAGSMLHLSFGTCTANLILKEQVEGVWQGGAVRLPIPRFLSGVCRARFRTTGEGADGHLYVTGLDGWSTLATKEGSLQRVRYVGGPLLLPTSIEAHKNGIELGFVEPLDRDLASNPARYAVDVWNYQWTKDYGSKDYSAADPTKEGRDSIAVKGVTVSDDGRRVFIRVDRLEPVMQLRVQAGLKTAAGAELPVDYYGTVHRVREAKTMKNDVAHAASSRSK